MSVPDIHQQRRVLRLVASSYPNFVEISIIPALDSVVAQRTLFYLAEKELIEPRCISDRPGQPREMLEARVTAKGLELIEDKSVFERDEGSAEELVDVEAFRYFVKGKIDKAGTPDAHNAISRLSDMSERELKALLVRLVQFAAEKPTMLIQAIQSSCR